MLLRSLEPGHMKADAVRAHPLLGILALAVVLRFLKGHAFRRAENIST